MHKFPDAKILFALLLCISFRAEIRAAEPPFDPTRLEVSVLAVELLQPMELAVAADGRVYFIELSGRVKRYDPRSDKVETLAELKVYGGPENGLIGLALDPQFDLNHWLYLQYSPPDYSGEHVSRFTLIDDRLDLASEKVLFKFEEQRKECCHHAGSMTFGSDGCLYIGTGDNTNPGGDSEGYAPIDERPDHAPWDAQKSAANSRSGAGKILRIKPTADGGYEIPDGNLFPRDGSQGLPEIYVMGCRNPWRISVDAKSGFLYWGEVGPDAGGDGPRGPRGYDEINQARAAGNFGWPYFIANNQPYHDYDLATGKVGELFNVNDPINDSPNNIGARHLPPPQPALLYYPYDESMEFPQLETGRRTACAGPVYHFPSSLESENKFPQHFDDTLFIYEWSRSWIKAVHLDAEGRVKQIEPFMPERRFGRPIDMQFGPDGALYLIEFGETWGVNKDAQLIRIDYARGNRRPVVKATVTNNVGREPLEVSFSSEGSFDKDTEDHLSYEWRAVRAGEPPNPPRVLSQESNPKIRFDEPGIFNIELLVTDSKGAKSSASVPVVVGNARPNVKILQPLDGDFFEPDRSIPYSIAVHDEEDGTSDVEKSETEDIDFIDLDAPGRVTLNATVVTGQAAHASEPASMTLMKGSDCFNCHAIDQKRVGPPLLDVANKYRNQPHAMEESVKRVRAGSTGVWGKIPMIPHTQHTDEELRKMVAWVYSLEADKGVRVFQGFVGELPPGKGDAEAADRLALEATYIDRGVAGIPPLTGSAKIMLRSRRIEGENADDIHGPRVLGSATARGQKFLGAIEHGHFLQFTRVKLDQVSAITARVASAGAGGEIEVRIDSPDGAKLAALDIKVNGEWEAWYEVTATLEKTAGTHDVFLVFVNPTKRSELMNLDSIYFHR